jgi:thiamine pyrophosphokinase
MTQLTRALVFANGDLNAGSAVEAALDHTDDALIIAADGGARLALACDRVPDVVVGDLDSLTPDEVADLRARGAEIEQHPAGKDETDLELTLLAAAKRGATWMRIIGGVGDRIDQTLANIYLLTLPELVDRDVRLVSGEQTLWLIEPGDHALDDANLAAKPGDTISLIPLVGDADNVRTVNMNYPLRGETLRLGPARGVSNVIAADGARVSFDAGLLLLVHTPGRA